MTDALTAENLTKKYGRRTALSECTLSVPAGRVVGLVGPNGAGKSTLLQLACGLLDPTKGRIEVLGAAPVSGTQQVGFVAQDTPVYGALTVAEHLRLGAHLNPSWDAGFAERRIAQVGLDLAQKAGKLSGGQRAQLALAVAAAKRPELLLLDEPVAALDPLARRAFLQGLMELTAERGISVIMSSHLVADLERVCDYLIVLVASRVRVAGEVDELLAAHHRLVGPRRDLADLGAGRSVVEQSHTDVQSTLVVRSTAPIDDPTWQVDRLNLEDIVLAYLGGDAGLVPEQALEGRR
ncbi:ABC transporter ATP-binding protein [Actinoplanes sp. ATCC 53533]|uniref:ABC transporter ATP-binding protein n=1 Tax=Actinoplanes sp. ATCC 53533 TaxID=1288362 RepID=UPI000F799E77|nr:ABC transporter ATP-binding protein [Actinoplanes sp. ATCC 53533]RSM53439.1 ABC transporter ATP-binding protein [Actinoplanes sp. ATCC 53533]